MLTKEGTRENSSPTFYVGIQMEPTMMLLVSSSRLRVWNIMDSRSRIILYASNIETYSYPFLIILCRFSE